MKNFFEKDAVLKKNFGSQNKYFVLSLVDIDVLSLRDTENNVEFIYKRSQLNNLIDIGVFNVLKKEKYEEIIKESGNKACHGCFFSKKSKSETSVSRSAKDPLIEQKRRLKYVQGALVDNTLAVSFSLLSAYISEKSTKINDKRPPSSITLYRWIQKYLKSDSDESSLIPRYSKSGNRTPKVSIEHDELLNTILSHFPEKCKVGDVYDAYLNALVNLNKVRMKNGKQRFKPVSQESLRKRLKKRGKL